jgi:hypothetical protein
LPFRKQVYGTNKPVIRNVQQENNDRENTEANTQSIV